MTTPGQSLPDTVEKLLGIGAFQVGDPGSTNFGQLVTNDLVSGMYSLMPADSGNMLQVLEQALLRLPAEALQIFEQLFPELAGIIDVGEKVATILAKLVTNSLTTIISVVQQIFDIVGGLITVPINAGVALFKDWFNLVTQGFSDVANTVINLFDALWRALTGQSGAGKSAADVANAAAALAASQAAAADLTELNSQILAVRNNKSIFSGIDETEESNFPLDSMMSGGTDPAEVIPATASHYPISFWRAEQDALKGFISWIGRGFANLTALYIDVYKFNYTTSSMQLVHTSPDQLLTAGADWKYMIYEILDETLRLDTKAGDVFGVSWRPVGTGTHELGGISAGAWLGDHPTAVPARPAAALTAAATTLFSSITYSNDIPWFGIGIITGDTPPPKIAPRSQIFGTPGADVFNIPVQFQVAGTVIDRVAIGGGNGGRGAFLGFPGPGGLPGTWAADRLVYGTDIPLGTTQIHVLVGDGGTGSPALTGRPGNPGSASTSTGTGIPTLTAAGGNGAGGSTPGVGAGDFTWQGKNYQGGATTASANVMGNSPGGGGAGGTAFNGGFLAGSGAVFITVSQP